MSVSFPKAMNLFRCGVSLLAALGLFVGQLAALPHTHTHFTAEQQRRHDAQPHFHCGWLGADHHASPDGVEHDTCANDACHDDARHDDDFSDSQHSRDGDHDRVPAHDATAMYLPAQAASDVCQPGNTVCQPPRPPCVSGDLVNGTTSDLAHFARAASLDTSPAPVLGGSNVYLTLRSLRI